MNARIHCLRAALVAASITGFAAAAVAQGTNPPAQPAPPAQPVQPAPATPGDDEKSSIQLAFARADADGDGKLSPQEAARLPAVAAKFDALDLNRDGFISNDEFTAGVRIQR